MSYMTPVSAQAAEGAAVPIGLAALAKMAFSGVDMNPVWGQSVARIGSDPADSAAMMDLATIAQLCGRRADGLALQAQALLQQRLYRRPAARGADGRLRLLAFMAPGDFMANTPLEFLLEGSDISLDMLYVLPGQPLPPIPEHDIAIVAVGESDANRPVLAEIGRLLRHWPRPVLNAPERIERLSRDGVWNLLRRTPGIAVPMTARLGRASLAGVAAGTLEISELLAGADFPLICRPIASHAGDGLAKLDDAAALAAYLGERGEPEFYLSPFVDYRSADGLFRKYRLAVIEGRPFACHMAISQHWMVHYLNAGMTESAEKRAEEACFMAGFDSGFARRHAAALQLLADRLGLDYLALDCGETAEGELLLFEADVAMIVHAMDPPDLFPYKGPQMRKVFAAFRQMLRARAAASVSAAA